jgi:hypothetical protein
MSIACRICAKDSTGSMPYRSWSALAACRARSERRMPHEAGSSRPLSCHKPMLRVQWRPFSAAQALMSCVADSSRCAAGGMTRGFIGGLTFERTDTACRWRAGCVCKPRDRGAACSVARLVRYHATRGGSARGCRSWGARPIGGGSCGNGGWLRSQKGCRLKADLDRSLFGFGDITFCRRSRRVFPAQRSRFTSGTTFLVHTGLLIRRPKGRVKHVVSAG